jgi:hypothetical protein
VRLEALSGRARHFAALWNESVIIGEGGKMSEYEHHDPGQHAVPPRGGSIPVLTELATFGLG